MRVGKTKTTLITFQMIDRSIKQPEGVIEEIGIVLMEKYCENKNKELRYLD